MTKLTSFTAFFFILCFSCFVSDCLSRPISLKSADAAVASAGEIGVDHWFHHHPWYYANSPQSSPKYWPKKPHGWKWHPDWPAAHSPFPCPWWPKKDSQNVDVAGDDNAAAPPHAA